MNQLKLHDQMAVGDRAQLVLNELKGVFDALENECFRAFSTSSVHDDAGRRMCRLYLQVMEDVHERLRSAVVTGENAQRELMRAKDPSKWRQMVGNG